MQTDRLFPVPFHGDTVVLVEHDGQPFVAMKPIVENMGLNWASQFTKISEKFGSVIAIIATTGADGKQYEMICLPLRKLPAWMYSINLSKIKPDLREKIGNYQGECDEVLWQYWTNGFASRPGISQPTIPQLLATQRQVNALMDRMKRETEPAIRRTLHAQLEQACRLLGIPSPALHDIGREAAPDHESPLLEEFWEACDMMLAAPSAMLNHSRNAQLIALNLPQVRTAAAAAKLALPDMGELRRLLRSSRSPRFVDVKAVNSVHAGRAVKCWVFENKLCQE